MPEFLKSVLANTTALRQLIISLVLLVLVIVVRTMIARLLRSVSWLTDQQRMRWLSRMRNGLMVLAFGGMLLIWAQELRTLAFSIAAVAAALIIAMKELLLSLAGGVLRTSSRSFAVGDRVEIGTVRGDVVDTGFLTTTILEIGPGHHWTGRSVVIPNTQLLTASVVNETYTHAYVLHMVTIPLAPGADWAAAEELLLEVAHEVCEPYQEDAATHISDLVDREGITMPNTQPRTLVHMTAPGQVELLLRLPAPARDKGRIEQNVLREFLGRYQLRDKPDPR